MDTNTTALASGTAGAARLVQVCKPIGNAPSPTPHTPTRIIAATGELPASGYALEVDGRLKAEFATRTAPGQVEKS